MVNIYIDVEWKRLHDIGILWVHSRKAHCTHKIINVLWIDRQRRTEVKQVWTWTIVTVHHTTFSSIIIECGGMVEHTDCGIRTIRLCSVFVWNVTGVRLSGKFTTKSPLNIQRNLAERPECRQECLSILHEQYNLFIYLLLFIYFYRNLFHVSTCIRTLYWYTFLHCTYSLNFIDQIVVLQTCTIYSNIKHLHSSWCHEIYGTHLSEMMRYCHSQRCNGFWTNLY